MRNRFHAFAHMASDHMGKPGAFLAGLVAVLAWGALGPAFRFSDTWQLVINTATTIITFLMVFLIQHTQNRDNKAVNLKLDELIRAVGAARSSLIHLEELSDEDLDSLEHEFERLRKRIPKPPRRGSGSEETADPASNQ